MPGEQQFAEEDPFGCVGKGFDEIAAGNFLDEIGADGGRCGSEPEEDGIGLAGVLSAVQRLFALFGDVVGEGMVAEKRDSVVVDGVLTPGEEYAGRQSRIMRFSEPEFSGVAAGGQGEAEGKGQRV